MENEIILTKIEKQMELFFSNVDKRFFKHYCNCGYTISQMSYIIHDSDNIVANKTAKEASGFFIVEVGELVDEKILRTIDGPNSYKTFFFIKEENQKVYFNIYNSLLKQKDIERFKKIGTLEYFQNPDWIGIEKLNDFMVKMFNHYTDNIWKKFITGVK